MSAQEPGLDLHEWETRWSELEEALTDDPATALAEACDLIEETVAAETLDDDVMRAYQAARDVSDRIERNEDVDPGDIGMAVENLRLIRAAVRPTPTD